MWGGRGGAGARAPWGRGSRRPRGSRGAPRSTCTSPARTRGAARAALNRPLSRVSTYLPASPAHSLCRLKQPAGGSQCSQQHRPPARSAGAASAGGEAAARTDGRSPPSPPCAPRRSVPRERAAAFAAREPPCPNAEYSLTARAPRAACAGVRVRAPRVRVSVRVCRCGCARVGLAGPLLPRHVQPAQRARRARPSDMVRAMHPARPARRASGPAWEPSTPGAASGAEGLRGSFSAPDAARHAGPGMPRAQRCVTPAAAGCGRYVT